MSPELVERRAEQRHALMVAKPRPTYPLPDTLSERRLRMLVEWESCEALKLVKAARLEAPCT